MPIPLVGQCKEVDNVLNGHEFKYYHTGIEEIGYTKVYILLMLHEYIIIII